MPKFAFEKVEAVNGRQEVFQLVIDGIGQLDSFEQETSNQYARHFQGILAILEMAANGVSLPDTKYHPIHVKRSDLKAFECKRSDLRLYGCIGPSGRIIVLGGFKNRQAADIRKLESILQQLEESFNT